VVKFPPMMSDYDQRSALRGPCGALGFLLELHSRDLYRRGMPGLRDSAVFFRLWDLLNTLREPDVLAVLNDEQRRTARAFELAMAWLPWQMISSHPHISELPDDDLTPLMDVGRRLYDCLDKDPRLQNR
jgi:hypothetical protein